MTVSSFDDMRVGSPATLGVVHDGAGINVAVFSENADRIELCLFDPASGVETQRFDLPERTGAIWHGYLSGVEVGAHYGLRAHGEYAPDRGHRFNPHKLLLDPYAKTLVGTFGRHEQLTGYDTKSHREDISFSTLDSASAMPKCVIVSEFDPVPSSERPRTAMERSVIYEAHPKGLTQLWPDMPAELRGTYEALATDEVIQYLKSLGITAVELLPVHAHLDDAWLLRKGLHNYWGYNTAGFFAADAEYFGPSGAQGFRKMVKALHSAGIEVILDVVYNHTAEGDQRGPTLSFRGLDNASYYLLHPGRERYYINDTGVGNTLNVAHPMVLRLVLDSLRWWVTAMGVDGFRFDLATTLGREAHGFDPRGGFFDALLQDPVLADVKLIAEPWDIGPGGYRLGAFPSPFMEWNDAFRDASRRFWRGDAHSAQDLAERLLGSAGTFDRAGRRSWSSVNFVACHDGFTLADVTSYRHKHNEANGEGNNDGHNENYSDNCDVEGPTQDPTVIERRSQRRRNLLATVFLAQGTPMLLAGDEIGNSQMGNNNAYCQDNEISWIDWPNQDSSLLDFTTRLIALRSDHPALRQSRFLHGRTREQDQLSDVEWISYDGSQVNWRDPLLKRFCLLVRESAESPAQLGNGDTVAIVFNGSMSAGLMRLPVPPPAMHWVRALDTAKPDQAPLGCKSEVSQRIAAESISVFVLHENAPGLEGAL